MHDKVCLITGATSGIGKVTARELAKKGMTVLMVCRNLEKGRKAQQEIWETNKNARTELYQCDLAKQEDIVRLVKHIYDKHSKLDILINNAGAIIPEREITRDGFESTFAVNHLAPFLLTNLLINLLQKSIAARIITVSSEAHKYASLNLNDLQSAKNYNPLIAYGNSKLANILFTRYLSGKVQPLGMTANCLHPGVVATNFGGQFTGIAGMAMKLFRPFMIGPNKGAETIIYLATSPQVEGQTGLYFSKKKPKEPSKDAQSLYYAQELWEVSRKLTNLDERQMRIATQMNKL
jgi:NAD(P)-dependent dehydrogenase (short-subunit alcohol dehydrogenase family)